MRRHRLVVLTVLAVLTVLGLFGSTLGMAPVLAADQRSDVPDPLLRADVDRNGELTADDDAGKNDWTSDRGAILLPNVDDDRSRCPKRAPDGSRLSDDALAACHDAADRTVNGPADLEDLARLRVEPMPNLAADSTVTLRATPRTKVRLFVKRGTDWRPLGADGALTVDEARRGVDLAIEARDIVRDSDTWDGLVGVDLVVDSGGVAQNDVVQMRVAPVLFVNDLMRIERMMVSDNQTRPRLGGLGAAKTNDQPAPPKRPDILGGVPGREVAQAGGETAYRRDLRRGLDQAGVTEPFAEYATGGDIWVQDMFEPAYLSMPAIDGAGAEHRIRLYVRSANQTRSANPNGDRPLREGGRSIFTQLRGPDVGAVQQYDPGRFPPPDEPEHPDTFNSTGNFGAIPPYRHAGRTYPTGRMLYGSRGTFTPDSTYTEMLHAQGYQDPVAIDTSWLAVGHIDEIVTFLPADNARGWVLGVADPRLANRTLRKLVEDGHGDQKLVNGVAPDWVEDPELTVRQVLEKPKFQRSTRIANSRIDTALNVLKEQTGITEREIVRLPVLFDDFGYDPDRPTLYAYLPDAANGIGTGSEVYLAPRQHGPRVDGVDVFERLSERALAEQGIDVEWVEDWKYAHVGVGEIHCVTNAERDLNGTAPWWTE